MAVVGISTLGLPGGGVADPDTAGVPRPVGPVLRLSDATAAVEGRDYETLTAITNENLDKANGRYFSGLTDDGLVLVQDGPHGPDNRVQLSLGDPATGSEDVLPDAPGDVGQGYALELSSERIVISLRNALGPSRTPFAFLGSGLLLGIPMFAEAVFEGALQPVLNLTNRCRPGAKNQISRSDKGSAFGKSQLFRHCPQIGHDEPLARAEHDAVQQGHIVIHRCRLQ